MMVGDPCVEGNAPNLSLGGDAGVDLRGGWILLAMTVR